MQKRRDLFQYIRKKNYNIACLQDVHVDNKMHSYVKAEWGYNIVLSSKEGTNASRGVMILINNNFSCDIGNILTDTDGNFVIMELKLLEEKITLASIYGPNEDKPSFYRNIKQKISDFGNNKVIICGDWNLVIDPEEDTENYRHINNPNARQEVLKFLDEENYIDIYRFINDDKGFTWRRLNPEIKQARLDFFLISEETFQIASDCKKVSGYRTDHSGIVLQLRLNQNERGRSYWKFNNSLLKDKDYIKLVKQSIKEVTNTYKINNNMQDTVNLEENNNENEAIEEDSYTINDQLLLEMIILTIRGETIKYSSRKKKEKNKQEKQLEEEIAKLERMVSENRNIINIEQTNLLEEKKNSLQEIRKNAIEGAMTRSRCRYEDLGEKPSSFFFSLEKRNFTNKVITKIIENDGHESITTDEILNSQKTYFQTLYSEKMKLIITQLKH